MEKAKQEKEEMVKKCTIYTLLHLITNLCRF